MTSSACEQDKNKYSSFRKKRIVGSMANPTKPLSKKRKFVADGVFQAELNNFFMRELAEDGYSGVEVRKTPRKTEIIIMATRTQSVLGDKGRRIRELTALVQKRFGFPDDSVEVLKLKFNHLLNSCIFKHCTFVHVSINLHAYSGSLLLISNFILLMQLRRKRRRLPC
ncbi:unnamed protein product [Soboliphyme baturini]|uniref:KH type-2 domain-containing protein n=1 Tax=Soboliphyme baturini TaxID=241478 RepID=A0A183I9A0_9BILA|nr:unnamed protein product [Soboliphyme baturini]